jgi:uncharacterized protein involved in exopolysaccharide biosynthesis
MIEIYDVVPTSASPNSETGANGLQSNGTLSPLASSWPWLLTVLLLVVVIAVLVALLLKEKEKHKE